MTDGVRSYMFELSQSDDDNGTVSVDLMDLRHFAQPRNLKSSTSNA